MSDMIEPMPPVPEQSAADQKQAAYVYPPEVKAAIKRYEAQIAALPPAPDAVEALVKAGCNLRSFVDLFAGGDEAMRLALREFDAALAAIRAGGKP